MEMGDKMTQVVTQTGGQIVSMIPSGLFLLISTALAVSVLNLSRKKTLVQDSYAIESLARSNVLCLDKTGTLTDGTMQVEKMVKLTKDDLDIEKVIGSYLGAFEDKNVTSVALSKAYPNTKSFDIDVILPFSSSRKLSAVQFKDIGTYVLGAPEFLLEDDAGDMFNVLPVIALILLGFAILLPFLVRKSTDKKKKIWCMGIVIGMTLVFLVEASVPVQWTFRNFTTSRVTNKYPSDVVEIANTGGTHSVLLPEDYKIRVKDCNKDVNIFENSSSHYDESPSPVFNFALVSNIDYVVIKKKDDLGTTNVDALDKGASSYKYTLVKDLGDYIIYGSPNVV